MQYRNTARSGACWHNNVGTPMSHGCVDLPLDGAAFLSDWTPIGTPQTVIDWDVGRRSHTRRRHGPGPA